VVVGNLSGRISGDNLKKKKIGMSRKDIFMEKYDPRTSSVMFIQYYAWPGIICHRVDLYEKNIVFRIKGLTGSKLY